MKYYRIIFPEELNEDADLDGREILSGFTAGGLPTLTDLDSSALIFTDRAVVTALIAYFEACGWHCVLD